MLVEPPRPHVPAGTRLSAVADAGRLAAAAAALVLAVASRGDAVVLGVLLALAAAAPTAVLALATALAASSLRWGATSLEALSGAQAVLGPAVAVGPTSAALGSGLAGLALLLALGRWRNDRPAAADLVVAAASGAAIAAIVAGPAPGGALWLRFLAGAAGAALAVLVGALRTRGRELDLAVDGAATLAGLAALVAVRADGPGWSGLVEPSALGDGVVVALAVALAVVVGRGAVTVRARARWSPAVDAT